MTIFLLEHGHVELALAAVVVHVADFAENRPLFPSLIMNSADAPHTANEAIWIAAIEVVPVVEFDA